MSIPVTLPSGSTSTNAYGSARPEVGDYLQLTVGGATAWYTVRWVSFAYSSLSGPQWTIGAALPSDPPPPPPT